MIRKAERFENYEKLLNLCYLVGFGLFLGIQTLKSMMTLPSDVSVLQVVAMFFMLLWAFGFWLFYSAIRADKSLARMLGDELNEHIYGRVKNITLRALIVTQVVILVATNFASFSAEAAANFTIFVMAMSWV